MKQAALKLGAVLGFGLACCLGLQGCASRARDVAALPVNPAEFAPWSCERIDDELDRVQHRAADLAYAVDGQAGANIVALGVGVAVFWPALLAMRPDGPEAAELARLKGRFEALDTAARRAGCPPPGDALPAARLALLPISFGERLVYEERSGLRSPARELGLRLLGLRRDDVEFQFDGGDALPAQPWHQDRAGNVTRAPQLAVQWRRLLRHDMALGDVVAGDMQISADETTSARLRGQVVAVGPQFAAGRRFDVAVVELFGDAGPMDGSVRVEGVMVVDRPSGMLIRLDMRSPNRSFELQRRLVRIEPAEPLRARPQGEPAPTASQRK